MLPERAFVPQHLATCDERYLPQHLGRYRANRAGADALTTKTQKATAMMMVTNVRVLRTKVSLSANAATYGGRPVLLQIGEETYYMHGDRRRSLRAAEGGANSGR